MKIRLSFNEQQTKRIGGILVTVIIVLVIVIISQESNNAYEKKSLLLDKNTKIAELERELNTQKYFRNACDTYVNNLRENNNDLYWLNRATNNFYKANP